MNNKDRTEFESLHSLLLMQSTHFGLKRKSVTLDMDALYLLFNLK